MMPTDVSCHSEMVRGLVHVERVPKNDRGDDEVESHGALLLRGVRPVMDAALRMREDGTGE